MEADICDPNLTPISICEQYVQDQNINIYPLYVYERTHLPPVRKEA